MKALLVAAALGLACITPASAQCTCDGGMMYTPPIVGWGYYYNNGSNWGGGTMFPWYGYGDYYQAPSAYSERVIINHVPRRIDRPILRNW